MPILSKPGLIPLKIENNGALITSQINKINFSGSGVTADVIRVCRSRQNRPSGAPRHQRGGYSQLRPQPVLDSGTGGA
jgi:hypothetical protein